MKSKRFVAGLITGGMVLGLAACGPETVSAPGGEVQSAGVQAAEVPGGTADPAQKDPAAAKNGETKTEVIAAINSEPGSGWDPITGYGQRYDPILQSTLTKAYGGEITNDLATGYSVSDDGKEWTFTIREDAYYSNGDPVKASDVAFTYEAVRDNSTSLDLSNIVSAKAIDDTTVVFTLKEPDYTFVYVTYKVGIVPEALYDENYGQQPIGSGPFKLVSWEKGQQSVWEYNEYYYGKEPSIKRIVLLFMDDDAAFLAAQRGDVDLVFTNQNLAIQEIPGYRMENIESIDNYGIIFPTTLNEGKVSEDGRAIGNDVTGDVAIRRALSVGLDREALITDVFNGYGKASFSMCDTMPWFNEETALNESNSGIDAAIDILEQAGWVDSNNDGTRDKNGVEAEFELYYTATNANRQAMAMAVAEQAKALGIAIEPKGASNDDVKAVAYSTPYVFGRGDYTPNEFYLMTATDTIGSGWSNTGYYSNPVVDEYMRKAMASADINDVYQYYKLAQWDGETGASLIGDAPDCWLVRADHCYFVREGLDIGEQPIQPHCANGQVVLSNICDWEWK
ncbi:MAG: ABC transporter substrate-binding protein [Lachnospiraceae bacterium]|nr:ABC transporter substrate-binding protein [Lachnospiraceae bacterium]